MKGLYTCIWTVLLVLPSTQAYAQFKLVEEMAVGSNPPNMSYMLTYPQNVALDSQRNLYISDKAATHIKVFDEAGVFVREIGSMGRGPGEFQEITTFAFDPDDNLIVIDRLNYRVTVFQKGHTLKETIPITTGREPFFVRILNTDSLILAHSPPIKSDQQLEVRQYLVHVYEPNLEVPLESFGSTDLLWNVKDAFGQAQILLESVNVAVLSQNAMALVPKYYRGEIVICLKKDGEWQEKVIRGVPVEGKPYVQHPTSKFYDANFDRTNSIAINGRAGRFLVTARHFSLGVFPFKNGFVHFSYRTVQSGKHVLYVEVFDDSGSIVNHGPVVNPPELGERIYSVRFLWNDGDVFYLSYLKGVDPVVAKMRFVEIGN